MAESRLETAVLPGTSTRFREIDSAGGELIFLVHGFRGDHHGLLKIATELSGLTVIIPDLPGFGESESLMGEHTLKNLGSWLKTFVTREASGRSYYIVGHSFGSLVVSAAIEAGLRPQKTVLINPISQLALSGPKRFLSALSVFYYRFGAFLPEAMAKRFFSNPLIVRAMSEVMAKTHDKQLRGWIHDQHDRYFSRFADSQTLLEAYQASVSHSVAEFAGNYTMPTFLIVGAKDDITPLPAQLSLFNRLPSREKSLRIFENSGHLIHYEVAGESASLILDFLAGDALE